jgi:hypothetical protein
MAFVPEFALCMVGGGTIQVFTPQNASLGFLYYALQVLSLRGEAAPEQAHIKSNERRRRWLRGGFSLPSVAVPSGRTL